LPVNGVERMTGKMPVLLTLAAADEVTYLRSLQMRPAGIRHLMYETEHLYQFAIIFVTHVM